MTAEQQYNTFVRLSEWLVRGREKQQAPARLFLDVVKNTDLYLFSDEKVERSLEYAKESIPDILRVRELFPVIVADSGSVVMLYTAKETEHGFELAGQMTASQMSDMDVVVNAGFKIRMKPEGSRYNARVLALRPRVARIIRKEFEVLATEENIEQEMRSAIAEDSVRHAITAVEELNYTLKPRNVVVVTESKHIRKMLAKQRPGTLARANDRPRHIVLDPDEVKKLKIAAAGGTHASPVPHRRRAHRRTYKAERYKNVRGKTLFVKEANVNCIIGEEIRLPRMIYRVKSVGGENQ
ncbi:MAG: hypothetical protein GF334_08415 [Candidatus Altiarchaeales archaeon]|nr:hypothetical protein [Candidatus Altiarchaeales archaeon]